MKHALGTITLALTLLVGLAAATDANAQNPRRGYGVGVAGQGTDMWTQAMSGLRLFTPHRDDCNATTEVFVQVYTNSNSVDFGFCIDKDLHSDGVVAWEAARDGCLDDGKRLPEPGEFTHVCLNTSGLNNLGSTNGEWATNFPETFTQSGSNYGLSAPVMGPACRKAAVGWVGNVSTVYWGRGFRCVR
jgi:hypothetical protein